MRLRQDAGFARESNAAVGLLRSCGKREATTKHEQTYALPPGRLPIAYDLDDPDQVDAVVNAAATSARLAARDVARALETGAVSGGRGSRDLEVTRVTGWLGAADVRRLRALLGEAESLVRSGWKGRARKRYAVTWILTPLAGRR